MDYIFEKGKFTEDELEQAIITLFEEQDYTYVRGEDIHRKYEDILLLDNLKTFISEHYASANLSDSKMQKIINRFSLIPSTPLYNGNKETSY